MSELQSSLLIIGLAVVLVVYLYNWWQQRKYSRKFTAAFEQANAQEDPLYSKATELPVIPGEETPNETTEQPLPVDPQVVEPPPVETSHIARPENVCSLLEPATDYVAVLTFKVPAGADSLALLWSKRFDFGKSVTICGLNETSGIWEKVTAESRSFYAAFKLSLQLADRSGPVTEINLNDFRDLVRDIASHLKAKADLPDVAAAAKRALVLDNFCASVDQLIGLNILPSGERTFFGGEIARVAERHGMVFQTDGSFHLSDEHGHTVFSLGNLENQPFQNHTLSQMWVNGVTLLMDVPRVEEPTQRFDEMAVLARQLAMDLRAAVVDDQRVALGEAGFSQIRAQVANNESRMLAGLLIPGSAQARRLFS
jgi:FtsZ-interacting cell division protein ZipA